MDKRYWSGQTSQSWIDVQAVEVGGRFMSKWLYVSQLFDDNYISDLNKLYCELIRFLAEHDWEQKTSLFRLPIEQQDLILRANSDTSSLTDDTLFSRYEREMRKNSWQDNTAVIDDQAQYSYAQLTQGAERLSSYLFSQNIDSKLIAIWSEKGYNQIVSAIAIMKTGAGYLPMSYDWPTERVRNVLLDSGTSTVLISRKLYADAKIVHTLGENFNLIVIEDALQNQSITTVHLPVVSKHDISYVIYTSGSTGKPKGVTITHEAALNTIDAVNNKFQVTQEDKVLALSDLSFDLSVYDIFGLISVGGTIVFPSQDMTKTPKHWVNLINNNKITIWNSVPQLANLLVSEGLSISSLRLLLISGDRIPLNLPVKINQLLPSGKVISLGGATEASIWSIWYAIDHVPEHWKSIPYGIAMPNQKIYVLNSNYQHCPVDVVGEIYIGGVGVAKDYWNNQDLSNKAFIHHNELGIIYRTGDLGSWHYDGYVEYIGRRDAQTKIRGYRVELEEIEAQLSLYPDLRQVIVTTRDIRQEQSLVAYYIADHELDESAVKSYLASKLPDYMVPQFFIKITEIPVTNNGKVDKDALPIPVHSAALHIAPRNDLESKIHDIWSDVLNLSKEQISVTEDFFKLGGNSISVIKLVSRVNRELASNINIIAIYNNSTIARLAQHLSDHEAQVVIQEEGEI
jgi:amino acid adenylation domain-containing protein